MPPHDNAASPLDALRARIAAVDERILALLADRLELVKGVGAAKRAASLPVRSYATEAEVLVRFRENPYLYFEIQHLNRHSPELFALVQRSLEVVRDAALADDPAAFVDLMRRGREYFPATLPAELG